MFLLLQAAARRLEHELAAKAIATIMNASDPPQQLRSKFPPRPLLGFSSLLFPKISLLPPARVSLVRGCWCGLQVMLGLPGSRRADIGVRAMWVVVGVLARLCCRKFPRLFRLPLGRGLGEVVARGLRGGRIGVVATVSVIELNSLCRPVEMATKRRVLSFHVPCAETMAAVKAKSPASARTGAVGARAGGGNGGLWLWRRRRSLRFLGRFSRRRLSDWIGRKIGRREGCMIK